MQKTITLLNVGLVGHQRRQTQTDVLEQVMTVMARPCLFAPLAVGLAFSGCTAGQPPLNPAKRRPPPASVSVNAISPRKRKKLLWMRWHTHCAILAPRNTSGQSFQQWSPTGRLTTARP
jgi:hypothetical protein